MRTKVISLAIIGLIAMAFYNNCQGWKINKTLNNSTVSQNSNEATSTTPMPTNLNPPPTSVTPPPTNSGPQGPLSLGGQAMKILADNCAQCHGPNLQVGKTKFDVTSWDSMVNGTRVVVPNDLAKSILYTCLYTCMTGAPNTTRMPPSGLLAADQIKIIADWIMAGAPQPQEMLPPPVVEVFDPTKTPKTYVNVKKFILDVKCIGCHGPNKQEEHVRYDTYQETLKTIPSKNRQLDKDKTLVGSIEKNKMPPKKDRNAYPAVTPQELQFIKDWIALGAPEN